MPDDAIGHLGLNIEDFQRSIDKAAKATGVLAKAGILATGIFAAFAATLNNFRNLGKEVDELRGKFSQGTYEAQSLGDAIGDIKGPDLSAIRRAGTDLDNFWLRTKLVLAKSFIGWKMFGEDVADVISDTMGLSGGGNAEGRTNARAVEAASEQADYTREIVELENKIARIQKGSVVTHEQKEELLKNEIALADARIRKELHFGDRASRNTALAARGALEQTRRELEFQKLEHETADAHAQILHDNLTGNRALAAETEIRMEFEKKINAALKVGNIEAVKRLGLEQQTALNAEKIARHNQTPRERVDIRAAERKAKRDLDKQQGRVGRARENKAGIPGVGNIDDIKPEGGREGDLENRANRGAQGREIDEHRLRQRRAQAAINRQNQGAAAVGIPGEVEFYAQGLQALKNIDGKLTTAFKLK